MNIATIAFICSVVGAILGILGFMRLSKSDIKCEASSFTRMETKLDYIGKDVSDIKVDFRTQEKRISELDQRITRVEESAKSAHHRINELVGEE